MMERARSLARKAGRIKVSLSGENDDGIQGKPYCSPLPPPLTPVAMRSLNLIDDDGLERLTISSASDNG